MSIVKVIECPRDAMQGIKDWIPSKNKIDYIQSLLSVGFDVIDFGSFVSPRAVPQMKDTHYVLDNLDLTNSKSKLLSIVANFRGAKEACSFSKIDYLGYPFSISENFQMRNTNKTINESITELKKIISICDKHDKEIVIYLSMGFGNPYGDPWNYEIVDKWILVLKLLGIKIISISDTIGAAKKDDVFEVFSKAIVDYPNIEFGDKLEEHQLMLMGVSDILIEIYMSESALLRTEKNCNRFGKENQSEQIAMTQLYLYNAVDIVQSRGKEVIISFSSGDEQKGLLMGLKRFTKYYEFPNVIGLKNKIAQKLKNENKYCF